MKILRATGKIIVVSTVLLITATLVCCQADAQVPARTQETEWGVVDKSLSNLLNNGWVPINITATDVATAPEPGLPNLRSPGLRSESFIYLLTKNGKYITCGIANPRSNSKNSSYCRSIN